MYSITGKRIEMTRGDTVVIEFPMYIDGEPYELQDGDTVKFAVKKSPDDVESCIKKTLDGYVLTLDPDDTMGLDFGEYFYDVRIIFADGVVQTYIDWSELGIDLEAHAYEL